MPVIPLKLIDKYDAYVGRYAYLCGNENRERIDFVSIIMAKELIRVPRVLGESYNSVLIERLYEAGGNVMLDLIIYLGSYHLKEDVYKRQAKSLLRPAMYFCRFPLMTASIRKSCRVFSMMLISDTRKPSSVS